MKLTPAERTELRAIAQAPDWHGMNVGVLLRVLAEGRLLNLARETVLERLRDLIGRDIPIGQLLPAVDDEQVQLQAKAMALLSDQERLLFDTRVLQDIRPVLADRTDEIDVRGAMVAHTLRLTFVEGGVLRHTQVAVSAGALRKLGVQIERALVVDARLQGVVAAAGLPVLRPGEDSDG